MSVAALEIPDRLAGLQDAGLDRDGPLGPYMCEGIGRLQAGLELADPRDPPALLALLRRLYEAGRHDLALGRLFEGHIDALQILGRYGPPEIARELRDAAREGARLGVWNADLPGDPLRLDAGRLQGGKAFASGAGLLTHALVTLGAGDSERVQLLLVDLARHHPDIDRGWWRTLGMRRSETHLVRWHGAEADAAALIGAPGDYEREPWFSGGALRFVAVQAGGLAAIFDLVRDDLVARKRDGDPIQATRLSSLFSLAEMAASVCRQGAVQWFEEPEALRPARVASARTAVSELCERGIALAQQAVGVQALFDDHPLSGVLADLMVYLRQPAPDAQHRRVAAAVAAGALKPGL